MMMASTSRRRAANQDLPRQPPLISSSSSTCLSPLISDNAAGSISMEDLLDNICSDPNPNSNSSSPPSDPVSDPPPLFHSAADSDGGKIVEEVSWKEAEAGDGQRHPTYGFRGVTLEDYLTKAAQVEAAATAGSLPGPAVVVNGSLVQPLGQFGVAGGGGGGRGKRRASVQDEPPVDKATQQKQRRMIKNRESAARSRERKQVLFLHLSVVFPSIHQSASSWSVGSEENTLISASFPASVLIFFFSFYFL